MAIEEEGEGEAFCCLDFASSSLTLWAVGTKRAEEGRCEERMWRKRKTKLSWRGFFSNLFIRINEWKRIRDWKEEAKKDIEGEEEGIQCNYDLCCRFEVPLLH